MPHTIRLELDVPVPGQRPDRQFLKHIIRLELDSFSCFALTDTFSAVQKASGPVFMFCAPGHVFGGAEGVGSRFQVLRSRTRFRRYRRRPLSFSCFALPDTFSAVWRASGPVFMFCALGLIFGGSNGVEFRFHVLRPHTCFWRSRGRRVPFSCFALPDSFSAVRRTYAPVFMFCAHGLIFGGTEGVRSHFLWPCGVAKHVAFYFKGEFKDYSLIRVVQRLISFDQDRLIYMVLFDFKLAK
jgi:hypothetical protein